MSDFIFPALLGMAVGIVLGLAGDDCFERWYPSFMEYVSKRFSKKVNKHVK